MADQRAKAQALWYVALRKAEIGVETVAEPGANEVRVRALHSAISRGTERLVFSGKVPASEYQRMRAPFMAGAFPFPVKYGYAMVGQVEAGQVEAGQITTSQVVTSQVDLVGRIVFALHPHQTCFTLPSEAVIAVPAAVPARRAVLAANMETALNAVWDAAPGPCDRIAVIGAGVLGALVAYLCGRIPGAQVTLIDTNLSRAGLAAALGVGFSAPESAPGDCDLVVHASGHGAGLATALDLAGEEATVLELSWFGASEVAVPLGGAFHSRRLKLVSSQVGRIAPSHRPRWTLRRRLAAALDLLADPRLDALLAPAVAFGDLPEKLGDILAPDSGVLCQLIDYA